MAAFTFAVVTKLLFSLIFLLYDIKNVIADDILGCGGFVKSHVPLDFSKIEIGLYTKGGSIKEKTECAPTNGYYFLPLYEKGEYVLRVHPPAGWSFEPSEVSLLVDGSTDQCSLGQDVNFSFNGFGITGIVITAGQKQGPSGIAVQLINDKGDVRNTVTTVGGDFHFTPVIPGKYTVKASHPRWKLEPSQAVVQVKEGNTALPVGVLSVKGYDVKGSVTSFGAPLTGLYVLLYSKEKNQQFRVEGCITALLQGVPESPICYSVTDRNGEFSFGLVPAGRYKLVALSTPPGQVTVSYNVKPDSVAFTVLHDSLYIKNSFEVNGFTVVGTVSSAVGGSGLSRARVLLDDQPIGNTDASGKYTLPNLQPGTYGITFQHEQCEVEGVELVVSANGPGRMPPAAAARWRVCGAVTPPGDRRVAIRAERPAGAHAPTVRPDAEGKWCTFLQPGVYSANVELSEQEQRDGMQFFPLSQKIVVSSGPVAGVSFSQLKGTVSGRVRCLRPADCAQLSVRLRPLAPDGSYLPQDMHTIAVDGSYSFPGVRAGSAEVSVSDSRLCWRRAAHIVAVTSEQVSVPDFEHSGYVLRLRASHALQLEYSGPGGKGAASVPAGASAQCVRAAGRYTLTPNACHQFAPDTATVDTDDLDNGLPKTIQFVAVAHATTVAVWAPTAVSDLFLRVATAPAGDHRRVGPLVPTQADDGFLYEHTFYMADGEVLQVWVESPSLVVGGGAHSVRGRGGCQPSALLLRAAPASIVSGQLRPPVAGALVTLTADGLTLSQTTQEDGKYSFGPLDASLQYSVTAELESYVFGEPDENGDIPAKKLAEIIVRLVDDEDETPLQGALVSVSGGSFRRTAMAADGLLRLTGLAPHTYYVKPHLKEYRFRPPHTTVPLPAGHEHHLVIRGVRTAWSCVGRLVSLGGEGWAHAQLVATPTAGTASARCAPEEATTELNGGFRIRGLLPECVYTLQLKESEAPELAGLRLAKAPPTLEVKDKKDIEDVVLIGIQRVQVTDGSVIVRAPQEHFRTLRLTLATQRAPHTYLLSLKLDATGLPPTIPTLGTGSPSPPPTPSLLVALPRLPADNSGYIITLESTLSKATHIYEETTIYFNSDGEYKRFDIDFLPKVKSTEQELRQTSLLVVPFAALVALAYVYREKLLEHATSLGEAALKAAAGRGGANRARSDAPVLDKASIDHIVSAVNAAGKRPPKKKQM